MARDASDGLLGLGLGAAVVALGGVALVLAAAGRARAQALISVVPSLSVSESFSDNVDRTPDERRTGFTTNVTPSIRAGTTGGRLTGRAAYSVNFRFEHFSDGADRVEHDLSADLAYGVTPRWRLTLREEFRLSPDPTEALAFVTPEGLAFRTFEEAARTPGVDVLDLRSIRVREDELRNRVGVGTAYDLTPRWSVGADASWLVVDSRGDVFREDSQTAAARLRTGYALTPVDDVSLRVGVDATDFKVSPDATVFRAGAGWSRRLSDTLRSGVSGGYVLVQSDSASGIKDEAGWSGGALLTGEVAEGRWRLSVAHEVAAGDGSGDLSERDTAEVNLTRRLGRLVVGDVRLGYLRQRSVRGFGSESDVFDGTVTVSYRFVRWAGARAAYRYRRDEPVGAGRAVDENNVLVGLEVLWPIREMAGLGTIP